VKGARGGAWLAFGIASLALSCGPASGGLKPVGTAEPQTACPGGRIVWNLEITDLRAERSDTSRVQDLLRQSLSRSFPGCQWASPERSEAPTIAIEVHRFAADFDGSMFEAYADWSVAARSASGQVLTQFDATSQVERPNYRGSNNEREALRRAFEQSVERTAIGLRNLPEVP
jgi:hypothetical protein